jgi:2,3-bisphosphoglycerate-dependent phosphoglycerate mutase
MKEPSRIIIVRHGQSEGNIISTEDLSFFDKPNHEFSLTKEGCSQATKTGIYLQEIYGEFDAYFCSTFRRTQETIALLYPPAIYPHIVPILDSRLNELMRGFWHTMTKDKLLKILPNEQLIRDREGEYHYQPPAGQSCQDVEILIYSFMADLRENFAGKKILITGHGNWMLIFWRLMLGLPTQEYENRYREINGRKKYDNCALAVYENIGGKIKLVQDNFIVK